MPNWLASPAVATMAESLAELYAALPSDFDLDADVSTVLVSDADLAALHAWDEDTTEELSAAPDLSWADSAYGEPRPSNVPPILTMRQKLLSVSGLANLAPVEPLVDGLLYQGTLAQLSGPPGQYKSFFSQTMACSIATGHPFGGRETTRGKVLYIAAEGASGMRARILAWCELSDVDPIDLDGWLYVMPEPVQMGNGEITELTDLTKEVGGSVVIFDTRARCTVGLEENSATEQGLAISNAERIIRETGATVLVVHHSGRAGDHGRGSTAWDGAVWSDLRMSGDELRAQVHCHKHKDVEAGCTHHYRLIPHTVSEELMPGCDEEARSTLKLSENGPRTTLALDTRSAALVRRVLSDMAGPEGLSPPAIRDLVIDHGGNKTQAYEAIKALVTSGFAENVGTTKSPKYITNTPLSDEPMDVLI